MTVDEAISEFLTDHRTRGSRPRTIEWHAEVLHSLLKPWLSEDLAALTVFTVNKALDRDVKQNTRANYERSLRAFTNWLLGVELLSRDPFKGKPRAKQVYEPKRVLTHEEIQALFKAARAGRSPLRGVALLALFLDTGLRASEVARLKLADVDWQTGFIHVDGKTGFSRVACGPKSLKALRRYVTHGRKATDPHLFVARGKPTNQAALTRWSMRLSVSAGIGQIGCHTFRRTFATIATTNGMDFFTLQRAMRHSTPAMTQRYVVLDTQQVQRQVVRCSPLAGLTMD